MQQQTASFDKILSKLADNQATLLSMTPGKPQASPTVGMNSISIKESLPTTFEETYNELLNYTDILEPLLLQFGSLTEEQREEILKVKETVMPIEENDKQVEEIKMLNDTITEPLLDLDKCSLNELISILQKFANDPSVNVHQAGFGSYIANHVLKEKTDRYNRDAMIPPKLGDLWIPKIDITIGKVTWHAILDLGSSVSAISKALYDKLNIGIMEKCDIDLLLADTSTKHALGRVNNVKVELHMTFVPVDFVVMDMESNSSSPIILGRPFLRTTGAIIDSKEGNVKFQFPHKKCMEHFPRKKEVVNKVKLPHDLYPS